MKPTSTLKRFPMHAILTMKTDICMGDFGTAQELAEWVMGHSVWTHELLIYAAPIKKALEQQFPLLPTLATTTNWEQVLADTIEKFGESLEVEQGCCQRTRHPIETAADVFGADKTMVVVH